jgi:hypothetical protein
VGGDVTWFPVARKAPPLGTKRGDGTKTWVGVGRGEGGRAGERREESGGEGGEGRGGEEMGREGVRREIDRHTDGER